MGISVEEAAALTVGLRLIQIGVVALDGIIGVLLLQVRPTLS